MSPAADAGHSRDDKNVMILAAKNIPDRRNRKYECRFCPFYQGCSLFFTEPKSKRDCYFLKKYSESQLCFVRRPNDHKISNAPKGMLTNA
jgi:hypothetical protein